MKKLLTITLTVLFITVLSGCKPSIEDEIIFDLILGEEYSIELNEPYVDPGMIVKHNYVDISNYVTITGNVDSTKQGVYTVTYTLEYEGVTIVKTRTVSVGSFNGSCTPIEDNELMVCTRIWSGTYLNTVVKLNLYVEQDITYNTEDIFTEIESILAYYTIMSDKYTSYDGMMNVYEINNTAGDTVTVDERLYDLIKFTLDSQTEVVDFYNAALGPVLQVWHDFRDNCLDNDICAVPPLYVLEEADLLTDPANITLDDANHTLTMLEGMSIDLGGVSKGYVSREIIAYLDSLDLPAYLLNNGESNISIGGTHPVRENGKFVIGITDPENTFDIYATVYLSDTEQLVTSGDYQKYYDVEGTQYHHIIDPSTLMPSEHSRSVSIITTDPALADLYSTAIFNMSITDGQTFVNSIAGLEAIWFDNDGTVHFSENFEANHLVELY